MLPRINRGLPQRPAHEHAVNLCRSVSSCFMCATSAATASILFSSVASCAASRSFIATATFSPACSIAFTAPSFCTAATEGAVVDTQCTWESARQGSSAYPSPCECRPPPPARPAGPAAGPRSWRLPPPLLQPGRARRTAARCAAPSAPAARVAAVPAWPPSDDASWLPADEAAAEE